MTRPLSTTVRVAMNASTLLYLIRHGEVDPAWRGRIYGGLDIDLSERGRDEARAGAAILADARIDRVISSPLRRARFTADLVAHERGLDVIEHPGLVEIHRGDWAGRTFEELEARDPGAHERWLAAPTNTRPPGGESLSDLRDRVRDALRNTIDLGSEGGPTPCAVVTAHGWVVRTILCDALGIELDAAETVRMRTGSIHAVEWREGQARRLLGLDLDAPLPPNAALA